MGWTRSRGGVPGLRRVRASRERQISKWDAGRDTPRLWDCEGGRGRLHAAKRGGNQVCVEWLRRVLITQPPPTVPESSTPTSSSESSPSSKTPLSSRSPTGSLTGRRCATAWRCCSRRLLIFDPFAQDVVDGKYGQLLSNQLDSKMREDLERLKKTRLHRGLRTVRYLSPMARLGPADNVVLALSTGDSVFVDNTPRPLVAVERPLVSLSASRRWTGGLGWRWCWGSSNVPMHNLVR